MANQYCKQSKLYDIPCCVTGYSKYVEFCDRSTETGSNIQKGYMQMLAGAMSALRNPKAHANITITQYHHY